MKGSMSQSKQCIFFLALTIYSIQNKSWGVLYFFFSGEDLAVYT